MKIQSASEFLSIYGFAILGIAIFSIILYFLLTIPTSAVPNQCAFSGYFACKDISIGSNSITSRAVFLLTNLQQYAIANALATINVSNVGTFSGACSPNVILPGGDLECVINFNTKITPNQLAKGTLSLKDKVCASVAGNSCGSQIPQNYTGSFSAHISPLVPPPKCTISLNVQSATIFTGVRDKLTANVKILGYPISGASVNFTSTSSNVFLNPPLSNTDSNGNATSYALSPNALADQTLTATYANCTASNTISFVQPIYLTFTANIIQSSTASPQYQSPVVQVDSNQYYEQELPIQVLSVSGTVNQYSYNTIIPSTLTATRYSYSSIGGTCGASSQSASISPVDSCNVIGNYETQYFLTTSVNPSVGGSVSPGSGWLDSGNQITLTATANTGYTFAGFTGTGIGSYTGTASSTQITLNDPITETANFNINHYTLTLNPGNCGSVSGAGTYDYGTVVDFSATPSTGYSFGSWTGTGTGSYTGSLQSSSVTMGSNIIETATCKINYYTLTEGVSPSGAGTVSPGSGSYAYGTNVPISETPASGYVFTGWTCSGTGCYSGSDTNAIVMITNNVIETANFNQEYPVVISTNPSAASNYWGACFSLNANGQAGQVGTTCTSIPYGTSSATAMLPAGSQIQEFCTGAWNGTGGYYFSGWYVNGQFVSSTPCLNPGITTTAGTTSIVAEYLPGSQQTVTYTTPGTYYFTTPSGTTTSTTYQISVVGAGGGGGDGTILSSGPSVPGTGAGGGGYIVADVSGLQPGTTITVTVGAGGSYTLSNTGTPGGSSSASTSSFTLNAGGGAGGASEWDASQYFISGGIYCAYIYGGNGGTNSASGSNVNVLTNDQGYQGSTTGSTPMCEGDANNGGNSGGNMGTGGATPYYLNSAGQPVSLNVNGNPGNPYGGGGSGGSAVSSTGVPHTGGQIGTGYSSGGAGAGGMVSISWFGPPS